MSVLEAPQTWIAAAAVLVVAAVVLIALAPRRRRAPTDDAPAAEQLDAAGADPGSRHDDDDAVTGPVAPVATDRAADDPVTDETASWVGPATAAEAPTATGGATGTPAGGVPLTRRERRYVTVPDPARADGRAKDRLLAVLLADPTAAVDVVAAMPEADGASGASAAALLRAGLSPAQVANLCGVDEGGLADLVARDLGLLEVLAGRDAAPGRQGAGQDGRSRTEEPGRAWASAGSSSSSTTPTTG